MYWFYVSDKYISMVVSLEQIKGVKLVSVQNETYQKWNATLDQSPYSNNAEINARQLVPREMTLRFEVGTDGYSQKQGYENLKTTFANAGMFDSNTTIYFRKNDSGRYDAEYRQLKCTVAEFNEPRYEDRNGTFATLVIQCTGPWESEIKTITKDFTYADFDEDENLSIEFNTDTELRSPINIELKYTNNGQTRQNYVRFYMNGGGAASYNVQENGNYPVTINVDGATLKATANNATIALSGLSGLLKLFTMKIQGQYTNILIFSFGNGAISTVQPSGTLTISYREYYI